MSGGQHALRGKSPDIQEFLALPYGAETFLEAATANAQIHKKIGEALKKKDKTFTAGKSDEGAWIANIDDADAFEIIAKACEEVGNELDFECGFGVDMASSSLWNEKEQVYDYANEGVNATAANNSNTSKKSSKNIILHTWKTHFTKKTLRASQNSPKQTKNCLICGDDLFTTNNDRLTQGIKNRRRKRHNHKSQPNRHANRRLGNHHDSTTQRLQLRHVPPQRRHNRLAHRAFGSSFQLPSDQNRCGGRRTHRQNQRTAPN